MSLLFPRARAVQWNVFEGQKVGRLKYRFRASKAQDEMKKKNKCGRKNKLQTWKKRNLTLIFNFFHDLVPETLWVFWQNDGYNCEYMTISSAAKDMLQKLSRCNRNKIMIIYLVTRVFISLSHLHAMKIRKP